MLIQQLIALHPSTNDRFYRTLYESLLDPRLLTSSKQTLYLNVLFRALKSDVNVKRIKAFSKRLLQVIAMHQASFACGTLYLVRELENVFASLRALIDDPEEDDSDEEENFQDVVENNENSQISFSEGTRLSGVASPARASRSQVYDGRKRDPEHSNAEKSCLWELVSQSFIIFDSYAANKAWPGSFIATFSSFSGLVCLKNYQSRGDATETGSFFTYPYSFSRSLCI